MTQQAIPASPSYRYTHYSELKGIDLTCDVTQTPRNRAADLLNVYPDEATSNPRKRVGWRKLYSFDSDETFLGSRHLSEWGIDIIATNKAVYWHAEDETEWSVGTVHTLFQNPAFVPPPRSAGNLRSVQTSDANSVCFVGFDQNRDYRINIYGRRYLIHDDISSYYVTETNGGYVPITVISRNPDGTDGYAYEAVNAFTVNRQIQFLSNYDSDEYDSTKEYEVGDLVVYSGDLYTCTTAISAPEAWTAAHWQKVNYDYYFYPTSDRGNHIIVSVVRVEARDASGEWQRLTPITDYSLIGTGTTITAYSDPLKETMNTYDVYVGVRLTSRNVPVVPGQDDIRIEVVEFAPEADGDNIYYGYWNPIIDGILRNNVGARYGLTSMNREFYAAGNGKIYYTDPDNYDYLPDNNFLQIEVDAPIVGFHRKNSCLVAVTASSAEFTIFMISGQTGAITHSVLNESGVRESTTEEMTYFIAKTAIAGTGAISGKSFATLVDDALFLARDGIYGITSNTTTSETVIARRSELINPRLIEEQNLENAVATVWNSMYLLGVNNHVYLLDSRVTHKNLGVSYGYECYYWDNVPATNFLSYQGNLFFGDRDGNWCRFNTDISNYTAYEDDGTEDEHGNMSGGDAIHALYKLRLDSDNYPQYFKTLNKRGSVLELMQLPHSEAQLSYIKDGGAPITLTNARLADKFTWNLVDFEDFCFSSVGDIKSFYPKKKVKKYKYLQFVLESVNVDSNFGICGLTKTYYFGNFAKG